MAGKGGARPNSGPKGGRQLRTITNARVTEIIDSGCAPLDVMIGNMAFWRDRAEALGKEIEAMLAGCAALNPSEKFDTLAKLRPMLGEFIKCRKNSQSCAVGSAPYVHPRLASIHAAIKNTTQKLRIMDENLTEAEAAQSYAAVRAMTAEQLMELLKADLDD